MTFLYVTVKLKIPLNLKQYYNSHFNEKIMKSFKKSTEILLNLLYLYLLVLYMYLTLSGAHFSSVHIFKVIGGMTNTAPQYFCNITRAFQHCLNIVVNIAAMHHKY